MHIQPSISAIVRSSSQLRDSTVDIFQTLRNLKTVEDILQASVDIVHQVTNCDRAVVYSLQSDSYAKVIAETVTPGYARILGTVIQDTCFEQGYLEKYQKGRVKATSDIHNSDLSLCYAEYLEKIQVRANIVVPLIREDRSLLGLLIAHQCSDTRQWQHSEIDFLLKIADWTIEQIAQKEYDRSLQLQIETERQHQDVLEDITKEIHRGKSFHDSLQIATDRAKELLQCDRVVVYSLEDENIGEIVTETTLPSLAPILGRIITDPCLAFKYRQQYQDGRVRAINNIYEAGMTPCYIENLEKIAVKSSIVVPINFDNGTIYGLLVAHQCFKFRKWQHSEINSLQKIAFQTGLSISKTKLQEKVKLTEAILSSLSDTQKQLILAQSQVKKIAEPIEDTSGILVEMNNLNKLLDREINLINQNSFHQNKKDTKLLQIFVKKLTLNTVKLQQSIMGLKQRKDTVQVILDDLALSFNGKKSQRNLR